MVKAAAGPSQSDLFNQLLSGQGLGGSQSDTAQAISAVPGLSSFFPSASPTGTSDVNQFNQQILAQDPFNIAGKSLAAWQPDMRTWSPAESGVTSFTKNFLSGLLGDYAQSNASDQLQKVAQVLPQLQGPNAANVMAPEGVDTGPFGILKLNEMEKALATDQNLRHSLATTLGKTLNPDGTTSDIMDASGKPLSEVILDLASQKAKDTAEAKGKTATGNRAMIGLAQDASKLIGGVSALNTAQNEVKNFYGARTFGPDSSIGGAIDWLGSLIPNTNAFQYNKDLPSLNDPVTQAIAGATKQGTLIQNKPMLTQSFGQTADSMALTDQKTSAELASKLATYISTLEAAGWPQTDAPNGLPSLDDLRQKYEQVTSGQGLTPAAAASTNTPGYEIRTAPNGQKYKVMLGQ